MRRNLKRVASLILSTLFVAQLIPTLAFAASDPASPLVKEPGYQNFPTYYNDSHHVDGQVTHPDVVVLDEAWNGYRYWCVYTPNVMRTSAYENTSIVASKDGVHWVEPEGLVNPIEPEPPNTRYHNCDADMLYNKEYDAMMAYWNWADDQAGGVGAEVRLRISYDGVHWGVPVTYDKETRVWTKPTSETERQVADGPTDFITAVASSARYDMLSPTFVYDEYRDIYVMWANNAGDVGYNNGQENHVRMWYSDDGITWGEPIRVNNFLGLNEDGDQLAPWHQDVQYIPELREFVCLSQCFAGGNPDGSVLHLTKSKDGINWEQVGNKPVLSPGPDGSWDDFQIYRSCFYYEPGEAVGDSTMRVWYSALQKNTNGKMIPDSDGNLTIQAGDHDDRIWRIGYAENGYKEMMRALLNDPTYELPALVAGNELELTASITGGELPEGETAVIRTTFIPADTSDQVVKFYSENPAVATVDARGVITAVGIGETRIFGETREGLTDSITVSVVENPYQVVPQSSMTATATSVYDGGNEGPASNVLDGDITTIWHSNYEPKDPLPQSLTVTFDQVRTIGKYSYTPRQTGTNGTVTAYELYAIRPNGYKKMVAAGNWALSAETKNISFDPIDAVGMEMKVVDGGGGFATAAEVNVYEIPRMNPYTLIPQNEMMATATSAYGGTDEGPASNVLDNNLDTIWHTNYEPMEPLPQSITVSFGTPKMIGKYVYTPRQVGTNGIVTEYELYAVKADGSEELILADHWAENNYTKIIEFAPVEANGIKLKVIDAVGGYATAAEINVHEYTSGEPAPKATIVDDGDPELVYSGTWSEDSNDSFYNGTAHYTNEVNAAVELAFTGTAVQWYGQKDVNFGTADVYIDGVMIATVNTNGPIASRQLLFGKTGLSNEAHTIKIVCTSDTIDVDYLSYIT